MAASSCRRFQTVDLAVSLATSADYTVIATFALTPQAELVVLDILRVRMQSPDLPGLLRREYERWRPDYIGIEKAGCGLGIVQDAQRTGLPIRELTPDSDKVSRAFRAAARMESGNVYFPEHAAWRESFEHELLAFPNGSHDDMVDCLSYAVTEARLGVGEMWVQYMRRQLEERSTANGGKRERRREWSTDSPPPRSEVAPDDEAQ